MRYLSIFTLVLGILFIGDTLIGEVYFYSIFAPALKSSILPVMMVDGISLIIIVIFLINLLRGWHGQKSKSVIWIGILLLPISIAIHYGLSALALNYYTMHPF